MRRRDFLYLGAGVPLGLAVISEAMQSLGTAEAVSSSLPLLPESQARTLPKWFLENRVHLHTRLGERRWANKAEFRDVSKVARSLGGTVVTRHVKSRDEAPWWPSKVSFNGAGPDLAKQIIDDAHAAGGRVIAYYWHMAEVALEKQHPDWLCHEPNGKVAQDERGNYLDITGPFREVVLGRLLELAERGVDGFFFDHQHLPSEGCFDSALAQSYEAATGKTAPRRARPNDPAYIEYMIFQADKIAETFAYWQTEVHKRYPGVVFVVSTYVLPGLVNVRTSSRLAEVVDSSKTEFRLVRRRAVIENAFRGSGLDEPRMDIRIALGWATLRDAANGRPPHVWSAGFPNPEHGRAFAGAVITWGGIANMDLAERFILENDDYAKTQRATLKAALDLGNVAGPALGDARAVRWAAIHFPETARNARATDMVRTMREIGSPMAGAFGALIDAGLPAGVVTDKQLANGELTGYQVLFLPAPGELTDAQRKAVDSFRARGGKVIQQTSSWSWHKANGMATARRAFLREIESHVSSAPVRALSLPAGAHAVGYQLTGDARLLVAITNNFNWVQEEWPARRLKAGTLVREPAAAEGIQLRLATAARQATDLISGARLTSRDSGRVWDVPPVRPFALLRFDV